MRKDKKETVSTRAGDKVPENKEKKQKPVEEEREIQIDSITTHFQPTDK